MFRPMRRIKQQLSKEECIKILNGEPRGVLSVMGEEGYPYGLPMDFFYDPESGHLFFHSARSGHKIDALRKCDRVSFCVYDRGFRHEEEWALNISSVIIFGRVVFMEDQDRIAGMLRRLGLKYTKDVGYVEREIRTSGPQALCFELIPEHMTGKLVKES